MSLLEISIVLHSQKVIYVVVVVVVVVFVFCFFCLPSVPLFIVYFFLFTEHTVYTWGSNNFGQCGLGHTDTRVSYPTKLNMESTDIYQIAAGATHSILWTAIPTEMLVS